MDERQTKIVEGAGLEDSRINKEFLDLLQRWSTPVLLVVLVVAGAYAGLNYLERQRVKNLDAAFASFTEAELDRRPDRLLEVARAEQGRGAVTELATLAAADLHLQAYQLRIMPGTLGVSAEDRLDDAQAQEMLTKAGDLYARAFEEANAVEGRELLAIGARWGTAAVAMSAGRYDDAEAGLREIVDLADRVGYDDLASNARELLASLPALRDQRELAADLTAPADEAEDDPATDPETDTPAPDAPAEADAPPADAPSSDG